MLFDRILGGSFAGQIHHDACHAVEFDACGHRVTSGARDVGGDRDITTCEAVQEGALPDVRCADDRDQRGFQQRIQDAVRDLVRDFIRVSHADGFAGEKVSDHIL